MVAWSFARSAARTHRTFFLSLRLSSASARCRARSSGEKTKRFSSSANALHGRVPEEALDGRVRELAAVARPVPGLVQESGHGLQPALREEELVEELPDRRLLGVGDELPALPAVAEGGRAAERLPEL